MATQSFGVHATPDPAHEHQQQYIHTPQATPPVPTHVWEKGLGGLPAARKRSAADFKLEQLASSAAKETAAPPPAPAAPPDHDVAHDCSSRSKEIYRNSGQL